jgi:hypothetical protein
MKSKALARLSTQEASQ